MKHFLPYPRFFGSVFFVLCSLVSCNLFNNMPEADLEKKMDEAVAWANAPRIAVTVVYPQEWGTSPQFGTGRCLDNKRNETPRIGYSFTVQFNSSAAYGDAGWRAYKTSHLPRNQDWYNNTVSITETLDDLRNWMLNDTEVSFEQKTGSVTSVTVHINEAVTIVPFCVKQPRIVSSDPPLTANFQTFRREANREINITFAAPVDKNTLKFEEDFIEIYGLTYKDLWDESTFDIFAPSEGDMKEYFISPPIYDEDTCILTLQPSGNIPTTGLIIWVYLGKYIKSPGGVEGMIPVDFSYRVSEAHLAINEWQASYDDVNNRMEVNWKLPEGAEDMFPTVKYRVNGGNFIPVYLSDNKSLTIEGVPRLDDSGIREGRPTGNFYNYTISLFLGDEPAVIKLWNIPGMKTRKNWTNESGTKELDINVVEIANPSDLIKMRDEVNLNPYLTSYKNYILTGNITLTDQAAGAFSSWTPIGTEYIFTDKFYGNGNTIIIGSGFNFASVAATGIFGYVNRDAEIRDLCINYAVSASVGSSDKTGGIAGYVYGNTSITNCIVTGAAGSLLKVTSTSDENLYMGGITGHMGDSAVIRNCRVDINLEVDKRNTGYIYAGGAAGYCAGNDSALQSVSYGGTLTISRGNYTGGSITLYGGGIVGDSLYPRMEFCEFEEGAEIIIQDIPVLYTGGIAGRLNQHGYLSSCFARGDISVVGAEYSYTGGVVGYLRGSGPDNRVKLENCAYEKGSIVVESGDAAGQTVVGGCIAYVYDWGEFENCYSNAGITRGIEVGVSAGELHFGGFAGRLFTSIVRDCYNTSPVSMSDTGGLTGGMVNMGGFAGLIQFYEGYGAKLENCWSIGPVSSRGAGRLHTGALLGFSQGGAADISEIIRCYATGDVSAVNSYAGGSAESVFILTGGLVGSAVYTKMIESWASGDVTARQDADGAALCLTGALTGNIEGGYIEDCYALGTVLADNLGYSPSILAVGGLAGRIMNSTVQHCFFAKGLVMAANSGSNDAYAGGITGHKINSTISRTAVLGESITVKGPGDKELGRIYGLSEDGGASSANYAYEGTELFSAATYGGTVSGGAVSSTDPNSRNGKDVSINDFRKTDFWLDTTMTVMPPGPLGLSFNYKGGGIGGVVNIWNFSGIEGRGFPRLSWE